jgi:hypothetical protein
MKIYKLSEPYSKVIYVAGPYRALTEYEIKQNIERAEKIAIELWKLGWAVICPHKNTAFFDGNIPDHLLLEGYLQILKRCDAIFMMPGWECSEGAAIEYIHAKFIYRLEIFDELL